MQLGPQMIVLQSVIYFASFTCKTKNKQSEIWKLQRDLEQQEYF
jgi:hypothetical protein